MSTKLLEKDIDLDNMIKHKYSFTPKLTLKSIVLVSIFYIILILFSLCFTINFSIACATNISFKNAIYGTIFSSLLGCSVYYSRKLYKMSIGYKFDIIIDELSLKDKLENLGSIIYFIIRPIYAISFSIIIFLGLMSGIITLTNNTNTLTSNFAYISMFISYFIGFSSGKFLESLQDKSENIIDTFLNKKNN